MSIIIKGMEMPTCCYKCPVRRRDGMDIVCPIAHERFSVADINILEYRLDNCPLVPVPPHGRLIDADELMKEFEKAQRTMEQHGQEYSCSFMSSSQEISTEWYCVEDMLENAPTIIPPSGGKEDE